MRPFQARPSYRLRLGRIAEDLDASLVQEAAVGVDADRREARLASGGRLEYDALLIAIGARAEAVVGGGTFTPWDWGEGHAFRAMLRQLAGTGTRSVVFISVPPMARPHGDRCIEAAKSSGGWTCAPGTAGADLRTSSCVTTHRCAAVHG